MNRFIRDLILFLLPVFLLGSSMEILLRDIPNDYSYKKDYLDKNSTSIEILFLGSSHAFYDINPAFIKAKSFNAGYISQTLDYDYEILRKYENHWDHLRYIVLPISYVSLFTKLEAGAEPWRIKNYIIYYGMRTSNNPANYLELTSNKLETNLKRINSFYILGNPNITCSDLGWGLGFKSGIHKNLRKTGIIAARRHTKKDDSLFAENMNTLVSIISFAGERGITVVLYTPPAYRTYVQHLDRKQLNRTISAMTQLDDRYPNVVYVDYLTDGSFTSQDFYDADHLNDIGAEKFTKKIGSLIEEMDRHALRHPGRLAH